MLASKVSMQYNPLITISLIIFTYTSMDFYSNGGTRDKQCCMNDYSLLLPINS